MRSFYLFVLLFFSSNIIFASARELVDPELIKALPPEKRVLRERSIQAIQAKCGRDIHTVISSSMSEAMKKVPFMH